MQLYCLQLLDTIEPVVAYKVVDKIQLKHLYLVYCISRILITSINQKNYKAYPIKRDIRHTRFIFGNICYQTVYAGHRSHKKYLGVSKVNFVNLLVIYFFQQINILYNKSFCKYCIMQYFLICNVLLSIYSVIYLLSQIYLFFLSKILTIWKIDVNKTLTIFSYIARSERFARKSSNVKSSVLVYFLNMLLVLRK